MRGLETIRTDVFREESGSKIKGMKEHGSRLLAKLITLEVIEWFDAPTHGPCRGSV